MTTPGGVPNLPQGALTIDNLESKTQDMTTPAMRSRAAERFPNIFDSSTGGNALNDLTPIGIITQIFSGFNSVVANADPADIEGPDDLPGLLFDFIESLPVIGELVGLMEAILGTYDGDDEALLTIQEIFAPIRGLLQLVSGIGGDGFPSLEELMSGWDDLSLDKILAAFDGIDLANPGAILNAIADALQDVPVVGDFVKIIRQVLSGGVPVGFITDDEPNLLPESIFALGSIAANPQWTVDPANSRTADSSGAAKVVADGTMKALRSGENPTDTIAVAVGKTFAPKIWVKHQDYAGTGAPIQLHVVPFVGSVRGAPVMVDSYAPAGANLDWPGHELSGDYLVPAEVTGVQARLVVTAQATAGAIWWDDSEAAQTGLLQQGWVDGLPDALQDLLNQITSVIENIIEGVLGYLPGSGNLLDDLWLALRNIPGINVGGAGGIPNVVETFGTMWDLVGSALSFLGTGGGGLLGLADAAQSTSQTAATADQLSTINTATLGIRTNNPVAGALERTTVANFPLTQLGTAATPSNFGVTQTSSAIALVRMPESDTKGALYWRSAGNASITGFYLNFGKMALDGTITHLFQSGNLVGQLTSGWQWQAYTLPGVNQITHSASEVIVVEFVVVGSGTVSIAGLPMAWMSDNHPVATTARTAGERNTQSLGGTPTLSNTGFGFTGDTPWVGVGRSDVPIDFVPSQVAVFSTSGAFTYTIPSSMRIAGNIIDVYAVGGGGGGQTGGWGFQGEGGTGGTWIAVSLVYGVDIPLGTTQITGTVGNGGAGGQNPFILEAGDTGQATTVVVPGYGTLTAAAGLGGNRSGNNNGTPNGLSPGNSALLGGYRRFGGAQVGGNQAGNVPGGGAGGSWPAGGPGGGRGEAAFQARQP